MREAALYLKKNKGVTMIEVIAVLLLIGIIGTVVISRYSSTNPFKLVIETEILKGHLRHARVRSMGDNVSWGINVSTGSYTLEKDGLIASFNLPGEDSPTHNFTDGVTVTTGAGSVVSFDEWGNSGPVDLMIILILGPETRMITISQNTGFIQ